MHISDGILPIQVAIGGYAVAGGLLALTVRKVEMEQLPKMAVVSSAFFIASLVHVPLGPTSVHLLLVGLAGVLLGMGSFAAVALALLFQCLLFQFGGLTSLGINMLVMGVPALLMGGLFRLFKGSGRKWQIAFGSFCGGFGTLLATLLFAGALASAGEDFWGVAKITALAHLPVCLIEAVVSGFVISFLLKVKPEVLGPVLVAKKERG